MSVTPENGLISVIVPVYNVEKFLPRCLDSIINQTYPHLEIILVDDGSIDSSGDICDQYADRDNRIKVYHKINGGLSSARNYGLDRVSGTYIAYVDSDDWIDLDLYRRCIEVFKRKPQVDVVYYEYDEVYEETSRKHYTYRLGKEEGYSHNTLYIQSKSYRTDISNCFRATHS
ncbi:MAG: glycosyltransferase family 2 protein [Porphyromonadaceae bacterium]|nr:glycosyltransferase family 2 protein [Porphyromonadaceae bacterium]